MSGSVVLGMTRLSIINVEGGHQPIANEDGNVQLVFNGEVYNYRELRANLLRRGHRFATASDSEVLVHLYEDDGIDFVRKLNGMFAFALWDARHCRLFLVRDRLGIKPLYFRHNASTGQLAFASELKALLKIGNPGDMDLNAVAEYLCVGYITAPRTPFKQISKVRPGHYLAYADGAVDETRYWKVPLPETCSDQAESALTDRIRELLVDATRLQLQANVPVGLFASGGLDSSAIMWGASQANATLDAYLCRFDQLDVDTPFARLASASTGMRLLEEPLAAQDAAGLLPRLVWQMDEPLADAAVIPAFVIAREAAKHLKVMLNGTGGDEIFGGYARYNLRSYLPNRWSAGVGRRLGSMRRAFPVSRKLSAVVDFRQRYFHNMCLLPEVQIQQAMGLTALGRVREEVGDLFQECSRADPRAAIMYVDLHRYLPGDLFLLLDKTTMVNSLEARVPLLDHRLVEFMAGLPGQVRMREGQLKWLLRKALRGHLPDELLDRPKQGFSPPVPRWVESGFGAAASRIIMAERSRVRALLGMPFLEQWVGAREVGRGKYGLRLWALISLELWLRAYIDGMDLTHVSLNEMADYNGS